MISDEVRKNRIDNELNEIRDRRNVFLASSYSIPFVAVAIIFQMGQYSLGLIVGTIIYGFLDSKREKAKKEFELKMKELKKLEKESVGR